MREKERERDTTVVWKRLKYEDITAEVKRNGFPNNTEMGFRGVPN